LFWSLDFNVNPMCSVIGQRDGDRVYVLDELVLPDSNTYKACDAFMEWLACNRPNSHIPPQFQVYGDAAGNGRETSATRTDWQIIDDFFRHTWCKFERRVLSTNPFVKDRVNCVNARLRNHAGEHRLLVDPKCKHLILDLERVHWKSDGSGNTLADIDKSDPARSHVSDALGYMIAYEFSMRGKAGEMRGSPR
jgi:hypothetical protein